MCVTLTFSPMRTGSMPKNGLMAMAGTISAPSSAGLGAIHTPPVSRGGGAVGDEERGCEYTLHLVWISHDMRYRVFERPPLSADNITLVSQIFNVKHHKGLSQNLRQ